MLARTPALPEVGATPAKGCIVRVARRLHLQPDGRLQGAVGVDAWPVPGVWMPRPALGAADRPLAARLPVPDAPMRVCVGVTPVVRPVPDRLTVGCGAGQQAQDRFGADPGLLVGHVAGRGQHLGAHERPDAGWVGLCAARRNGGQSWQWQALQRTL